MQIIERIAERTWVVVEWNLIQFGTAKIVAFRSHCYFVLAPQHVGFGSLFIYFASEFKFIVKLPGNHIVIIIASVGDRHQQFRSVDMTSQCPSLSMADDMANCLIMQFTICARCQSSSSS